MAAAAAAAAAYPMASASQMTHSRSHFMVQCLSARLLNSWTRSHPLRQVVGLKTISLVSEYTLDTAAGTFEAKMVSGTADPQCRVLAYVCLGRVGDRMLAGYLASYLPTYLL